jgi:polysaccharide pyruvyl transferase WcaK-like protein
MRKLVVPFGFFGAGNIGDEATLAGFAALLARSPRRARVWVGSRDPAHTAKVVPALRYFSTHGRDPRRWWAKLAADAHVFVGGTPIMDVLGDWPLSELVPLVRGAARARRPVVFVGIGTEPLARRSSLRTMRDDIVPHVRHWSVRSHRDMQRLIECGAAPHAITVAADLAWLLDPPDPSFGRTRLREWGLGDARVIGVNLVNEGRLLDQRPHIAAGLAAGLDEMVRGDGTLRVLFLANEVRDDPTFDAAAARLVIDRMRFGRRAMLAPRDYLAPQRMMSIIACCHATISMRYHFCLFSALQGVPFVALTRCAKVGDLCADLSWPMAVDPRGVTSAGLMSFVTSISTARAGWQTRLAESTAAMRLRATRNDLAFEHCVSFAPSPTNAPEAALPLRVAEDAVR